MSPRERHAAARPRCDVVSKSYALRWPPGYRREHCAPGFIKCIQGYLGLLYIKIESRQDLTNSSGCGVDESSIHSSLGVNRLGNVTLVLIHGSEREPEGSRVRVN